MSLFSLQACRPNFSSSKLSSSGNFNAISHVLPAGDSNAVITTPTLDRRLEDGWYYKGSILQTLGSGMYAVQDEDQSSEVVAAADIVAQRVLPDPLLGTPVRNTLCTLLCL